MLDANPFRVSREKVTVPDPPADPLHRPDLEDRSDPRRRRLTVLVGSGGFGKTTLMAACCRRAAARGDPVVWLSIDESDDAERVVAHLIYAADMSPDVEQPDIGSLRSAEMQYLDVLMAGIRDDGRPFTLAFDELDRIPPSGARIVDHLIWRGPANLHLMLACRQMPRMIDIATSVVEGRGITLGPDDLRFSPTEVGAFFGGVLPPERLRTVWEDSQGWPIAVCLHRSQTETSEADLADLSSNWVASRLMRGVAEEDRRLLLQAACFDWVDAEMFDEVLGVGSAARLHRIKILGGLLQNVDGGRAFRLHALVRRHAENELRLLEESSDLHRRIAVALSTRGRPVDAIRHALEGNDSALAAEIFESAGGVRLVLTDGVRGLKEAVGLFRVDDLHSRPRLDLARLAVTALDARTFDAETSANLMALAIGHADEGHDDGDAELRIDEVILRGIFLMCGCAPIGSDAARRAFAEGERAMTQMKFDPVVAGGVLYGQAVYHYESGDLRTAIAKIRRVRELVQACPSVALSAWILEGAILFAEGDANASGAALTQARRYARLNFPGHESPEVTGDVFAAELAVETGRPAVTLRRPEFAKLVTVGAWLDVYAAFVDVGVEYALRQDATARAAGILQEAWEFAQSRGLWTFSRWLAATRVSALVRERRLDEAKAIWTETGLPTELDGQIELGQQSWREMEAICCAQVRLLIAGEEHARAQTLACAFAARARTKGLARTESWATAQAMHAAWLAGDTATAEKYLVENLRLFQRTGFSRALAAEPEVAAAVLERLDAAAFDLQAAKEAMRTLIATRNGAESVLTERELEVVVRMTDSRDKDIADALGLTANGVRYHVKNIFNKLGVDNRREAARKARQLGIVSAADPASPPAATNW